MMKKFGLSPLIIVFFAIIGLAGKCDKEPIEIDLGPTVKVNLEFTYKGKPFTDAWETNAANNPIRYQTLRFFITDVTFLRANDPEIQTKKRFLVDAFDSNKKVLTFSNFLSDYYSGLKFTIGIDSSLNFLDPASFAANDPLSSLNSGDMHWDWNTGYIFYKAEGRYVKTNNDTSTFSMHIGLQELARTIEISQNFTVTNSNNEFTLNVAVDKFLDAPNIIDLNQKDFTHSMGEVAFAKLMADNITGLFTLKP